MLTPLRDRDAARGLRPSRHWGGFLASGAIAFSLDAGVMEAGIRLAGLPVAGARGLGIAAAMVGAWLAHRHLTFDVQTPPSLAEFARFVAAAATTAAINYATFLAILLAYPAFPRLPALVGASIVATIFSYASMRYGVFRRDGGKS
jgi:putative flippase GtrA